MTDSTNDRPFNLIRWFSAVSLLSILLISGASAILLSRYLTDHILSRDAAVMMDFVNSIVRAANLKHAQEPAGHSHVKPLKGKHPLSAIDHYLAGHRGKLAGQKSAADAGLAEFFKMIAQMPDVLRVNIYTQEGTVVWSSSSDLIGKHTGQNDELVLAFTGKPTVTMRYAEQDGKPEHTLYREPGTRYVENYLPIFVDDGATVAAVVEVYRSPQALFDAVASGGLLVWIIAGSGGAFIYLALFMIIRRADVTLRIQHEKLVDSERFAVIGEMASTVAHGVRNPLASIRSSADLMLGNDLSESMRESLNDIVSEADRLGAWVRNFLTRADNDWEMVRVDEVISDCAREFTSQAMEKGIKFNMNMQDGLPPIKANAATLHHAISNIISNGLEAMSDGGEQLIETQLVKGAKFVKIVFTDTGEGISEERLAEVFKPLVTNKNGGLGMGLPLAKRIVERLGGRLEISSVQGKGTSVSMQIPPAV